MLLSMTGQGQGRTQHGSTEVAVEVRAVNNRHLKIHTRTSDGLGGLEPKIDSLVRRQLRRGSLQLGVQVTGSALDSNFNLRPAVVESYWEQCRQISQQLSIPADVRLGELLTLPGVVADPKVDGAGKLDEALQAQILETVDQALANLNHMRRVEGESMALELASQLQRLREGADTIKDRAPQVVEDYRFRLNARLSSGLADVGVQLHEADLAREVLVMADKADIREELVRLRSHFSQFQQLLDADESQGRKLDFLIQEIFRETNTIGAKANDAEIAQRAVDMKAVIEQMRELVQNVE